MVLYFFKRFLFLKISDNHKQKNMSKEGRNYHKFYCVKVGVCEPSSTIGSSCSFKRVISQKGYPRKFTCTGEIILMTLLYAAAVSTFSGI